MKYTITINQLGILYAGLIFETDLIDWAIVDYLKDFIYYKQSKRVIYQGEEYIWLNYKHLMSSMPLLKFNGAWTISRRINKLRKLGLIKTVRTKDNTLYYTFTDKLIDVCFAKKSDIEKLRKQNGKSDGSSVKTTGFLVQNGTDPIAPNATDPVASSATAPIAPSATAQYITKYQLETNNQLVTKNKINDISFSSFSSKEQRKEPNPIDDNALTIRNPKKELNPIDDDRTLRLRKEPNSLRPNQNKNLSRTQVKMLKQTQVKDHQFNSELPKVTGFTTLSDGFWKIIGDIKVKKHKCKPKA